MCYYQACVGLMNEYWKNRFHRSGIQIAANMLLHTHSIRQWTFRLSSLKICPFKTSNHNGPKLIAWWSILGSKEFGSWNSEEEHFLSHGLPSAAFDSKAEKCCRCVPKMTFSKLILPFPPSFSQRAKVLPSWLSSTYPRQGWFPPHQTHGSDLPSTNMALTNENHRSDPSFGE